MYLACLVKVHCRFYAETLQNFLSTLDMYLRRPSGCDVGLFPKRVTLCTKIINTENDPNLKWDQLSFDWRIHANGNVGEPLEKSYM